MSIDVKKARAICTPEANGVPDCCVANCPNSADPRFGIEVQGTWAAACDGHESYRADSYQLRDPLPRWPLHQSQREKSALELLPAALDEIERLRALVQRIDETLRVPAAEYVPAISDVFALIDASTIRTATKKDGEK